MAELELPDDQTAMEGLLKNWDLNDDGFVDFGDFERYLQFDSGGGGGGGGGGGRPARAFDGVEPEPEPRTPATQDRLDRCHSAKARHDQVNKAMSSFVLPLQACCLRQCLSSPSVCPSDQHESLKEFKIGPVLGEGAYATVHECTEISTGTKWCAVCLSVCLSVCLFPRDCNLGQTPAPSLCLASS
eukprot:SAG22_NODE_993_length_6123_cov_15.091799_4_plen_186_part_00